MQTSVEVTTIGGCGGFGMNATLFRCGETAMLVDFGIGFPRGPELGVNRVHADVSSLLARIPTLSAIVLTHAHDDHVGALPYLPEPWLESPVYGTEFTLAVARERCDGEGCPRLDSRAVAPGGSVTVGPFEVSFASVTHSIPEACALIIESPVGTLVHSGDFKLDRTPFRGPATDLDRLAEAGRRGVRALFLDSTGVRSPGWSRSESDVAPVLERCISNVRGQVIVSTFASHLHRIDATCSAARALGRKVAFLGQRMKTTARLGLELGLIELPAGSVNSAADLGRLPPEERLYLAGGCQGEPFSSLGRISRGAYHDIAVGPADCIVISASIVPGGEVAVTQMLDRLLRLGADVIHADDEPDLHASGHGKQDEIRTMIETLSPELLVPIHGDRVHLERLVRFAASLPRAPRDIRLIEQGEGLVITSGTTHAAEKVEISSVYRSDADLIIDAEVARQRRQLGVAGCVLVRVRISGHETAAEEIDVRVEALGVAEWDGPRGFREKVQRSVQKQVASAARNAGRAELESLIVSRVRSILRRSSRLRPSVVAIVDYAAEVPA